MLQKKKKPPFQVPTSLFQKSNKYKDEEPGKLILGWKIS